MCFEFDVDGLWGDIVSNRVVKVLVVFRGRDEVILEDIGIVMFNCLWYCLRKDFFEFIDLGILVVDKFNEVFGYFL